MRKARLLRKRRISGILFFAAFSWAGMGMGLDIKSGLIAKDFADFFETRLNKTFVNSDIRLSGVEGGGFNKLAVRDFKVYRRQDPVPLFSVDKIIINYSLWDLALRRFENLGKIYLVSPSLSFAANRAGNLALPQGASLYLSGASAYAGRPIRFHILNGGITAFGRTPVLRNLKGVVEFSGHDLRLSNMEGAFLNMPVVVNGSIDDLLGRPAVKLRLLARDRYYSVRCAFKGLIHEGEGRLWGDVRLFDRFTARFKGRVGVAPDGTLEIKRLAIAGLPGCKAPLLVNGDINLTDRAGKFIIRTAGGDTARSEFGFEPPYIKLICALNKGRGLSVYAKISHVNFFGHDLLSQAAINLDLYKASDSSSDALKVALKTQNLILDYRPFKEIEANIVLKKRELFIANLELKDGYRLFGKVLLNRPYSTELNLSIINGELADWLLVAGVGGGQPVSGVVNGKIKVRGPLNALSTDGRVNIKDGNINNAKFNAINFSVKGKGPTLLISDSRVFKDEGVLFIDGEIDVRKLGRRNIFEDLKITTDDKVIVWEGWDIAKSHSEVQARKDLGEDFDVNFKTYIKDAGVNLDKDEKKNEIGLDYKIKKDDSINLRMKDDSAFVGVEHKVKF
ncbi:MAG: hypothetical protein HY589_02185 [Candidatus Omnitrophica bacterium]|nr:hypothetical protein [Candidatus Omnitrophota bacterium]